jgi:hypothetical protein
LKQSILAVAAIVTAVALTGVAFAIPQQVMAGGHRHYHNHNGNSVKVDQQINQQNQCNGQQPERAMAGQALANASQALTTLGTPGSTTCLNLGENTADIGH